MNSFQHQYFLTLGFAEIVKEEYADPSEETLQQFKQHQAESHRVQVKCQQFLDFYWGNFDHDYCVPNSYISA